LEIFSGKLKGDGGIFNCSDFHYTIKPFWVDDFGAKYKQYILLFGGARHHLIFNAHAERAHQFLTHLLSDVYAQYVLKGPFQISYVHSEHV
jgi:hypothetical protein